MHKISRLFFAGLILAINCFVMVGCSQNSVSEMNEISDTLRARDYLEAADRISMKINSAVDEVTRSNANSINDACRLYYYAVASGALNSNEMHSSSDRLPGENASEKERKQMALNCTVYGALEYEGLTRLVDSRYFGTLGGSYAFCVDENGDVRPIGDVSGIPRISVLKTSTTFAEMGYE